MAIDLQHQVELLQAVCRRLALQPNDESARQYASRAVSITPLLHGANDTIFVRALLSEARASAETLAFRLEGAGCDRLTVCTLAAALSRALAELRSQLKA